ncbi:hypothetical protein [Streptomyces sp. NPDC088766]|uniref:hypothetical protein n=1 Tax=Streptomyces sp. NPDC088766 TaxID=3365893 RepID=UPI0038223C7A
MAVLAAAALGAAVGAPVGRDVIVSGKSGDLGADVAIGRLLPGCHQSGNRARPLRLGRRRRGLLPALPESAVLRTTA